LISNRISSYRWSGVGRWRIFHPDSEEFTCSFTLPTDPLVQWVFQCDGSRHRAVFNTASTKPAFIRIEYDRRFALLRVVNHHIHPALIGTYITLDTEFGINFYRYARR